MDSVSLKEPRVFLLRNCLRKAAAPHRGQEVRKEQFIEPNRLVTKIESGWVAKVVICVRQEQMCRTVGIIVGHGPGGLPHADVSHARIAISAVDHDVMDAARVDGADRKAILLKIILPLARPGLIAGSVLTFARALGDFGATLMVAGDTPGRTQTMPLAIYDAVMNDDLHTVGVFIALTVGICIVVTILASQCGGAQERT